MSRLISQTGRFRSFKLKQKLTALIADKLEQNFTEREIIGIKMPQSPQDLERLPEGERSQKIYKIFTNSELKLGDRIKIKNDVYRVLICDDYSDYGYYDTLATRLAESESDNGGGFEFT